ncbi:MAG: hypothetical protein ACXVW7_09735 [Trebonia sp.]
MVVGVLALRGALTSKKPPHTSTPSPTSTSPAASVQRSSPPVLLVTIAREPCTVFVKNAATNVILQSDNTPPPPGAKLVFSQVPLQVQISDPRCANVYVHGHKQPPSAVSPWIFSVQS